jgi:surface protein
LYPLAVTSLLLFSACQGDGGASSAETQQTSKLSIEDDETKKNVKFLEGQLIDSAMEGIKYETNSGKTGNTNENGTFSYRETDKTITFKIGSLIIAKDFDLSKINNDSIILPADIVGVDRNNTSNKKMINLLRVLQSLDNDNNPNNGIVIDDNTKGYLNEEINIIDADISKLETIVKNAQKTFKSQRKSREHYIQTLRDMKIDPVLMTFNTVWKTTSDDENITIPTDSKLTYNYTIDWGDGDIENNKTGNATHTYSGAGDYTVIISGDFPAMRTVSDPDAELRTTPEATNAKKLQKIAQWGDIEWGSFKNAFASCENLDVNATDTPALNDVNSTNSMFYESRNLKGNRYFNDWDVSSVTDMSAMFKYAKVFNQPLNDWDVSSVTDVSKMFSSARAFNQPLNNWNVSNVTNMLAMFSQAFAFNQPLNNWNVGNVTNMFAMFRFTKAFNQPLNNWNVSSVTDMRSMFYEAKAFTDQNLSSWDVGNVPSDKHKSFIYNTGGGNTEPNWQ